MTDKTMTAEDILEKRFKQSFKGPSSIVARSCECINISKEVGNILNRTAINSFSN